MSRFAFFLFITFLASASTQAGQIDPKAPVIGRISGYSTTDPRLRTLWGEKNSAEGRLVREGETIQSVAGQQLVFTLNDRTVVTLGPSSRIEFNSWTARRHGRLQRKLVLQQGIARFKVSKVYSQVEPFIVRTPQAIVAVRGTEFVVEAGEGGHLVSVREQLREEIPMIRQETELHVLEGQVWFAKNETELEEKAENRVAVNAGETSLIRGWMKAPQRPHSFQLALFQKYYDRAIQGERLALNFEQGAWERANSAMNSNGTVKDRNRAIASQATTQAPPQGTPAQAQYKEDRRVKFLDQIREGL